MAQFDQLKAALADRYSIDREVGSGGMATVYLAEDLKHHRQVAVKVLRTDLAATLGPDRFLREIEIAAQLQHPHVLPLYDSGQADGFLYYVMPFVEGESLRQRLARERELPITEAARILRDVVDALAHAHGHGVVHRDIKPDNVMLSGRHALVTDFGVAKAVSEATGREKLTTAGVALGTPSYMAPEQAVADTHIDHRADIYAVGALAYELLTGRPPFAGDTPQMVLSAHVTQAPEPVTRYRETVPAPLAELVMKCLAKKPADRWQSAEELLPQLEALATPSGGVTPTDVTPVVAAKKGARRWMVGTATAALVVMGAGAALMLGNRGPALDPERVVVAPFENQSGIDSLDVFGDILADYLANQIARTGIGDVVPSATLRELITSAGLGGGQTQGLARATGAGIVISGTYFIQKDSLAIQAQITDANASRLLSAVGPFGDAASEPMSAAAVFGQRLLGSLALIMDPDAPPATVAGQPPSFEAYRDYTAARELAVQGEWDEALELLYRALSVDSTFAAARLFAAVVEWNATTNIGKTDSLLQVTDRYRDQLAQLDVAQLDWLQAWVAGDKEAVLREARRMAELDETLGVPLSRDARLANRPLEAVNATMSSMYDRWLTESGMIGGWADLTQSRHMIGDHENELRDAETARELNPDAGGPLDYEIRALAALGRLDEVRDRFDDVLARQRDPGWSPGGSLRGAAVALRAHGHHAVALEALDRALEWYAALPASDYRALRYSRARTMYVAERWADAKVLIDSLRLESPDDINRLGYAGTLAARLGDREEALRISEELAAIDRPYVFGGPTRWRARIAALLGQQQEAVSLLTQSYEEGTGFGTALLHDIDFESLRGYPPFDRFIEPKG